MNQTSLRSKVNRVMARALATGLFRSLCTFQVPDGTLGASGAPSGLYTNVAGLVNIPCMDAPQPAAEIKVGASEVRQPGSITDDSPRHVLLGGYYPTVITLWRTGLRAVVDGVTYDVCGAECDSQRTQVRCEMRLVTAGAVQ